MQRPAVEYKLKQAVLHDGSRVLIGRGLTNPRSPPEES